MNTKDSDLYSRFVSTQTPPKEGMEEPTLGLVKPSDQRKKKAESEVAPNKKKKKGKKIGKSKLSFANDDDDDDVIGQDNFDDEIDGSVREKPKFAPNLSVTVAPLKALTKSVLAKEAKAREKLRKEFPKRVERVRATEIAIPFVFYDGTVIPGGICRVKKGDHVLVFLDKARKVGAGMGVGTGKGWARVSVDDLLLVRGDLIIPHHYEFYYFMINKSMGFNGQKIFDYSSDITATTPEVDSSGEGAKYDALNSKKTGKLMSTPIEQLEGFNKDGGLVKVVDRRWYEKNKHIFPASLWEEFDAAKDYDSGSRTDSAGNALFLT